MAALNLVVLLKARDRALLAEFEARAVALMRAHGATLYVAFRPEETRAGVDEVHVLRFPDRAAFEAYRADPGLAALADLRERAIADTTVLSAASEVPY